MRALGRGPVTPALLLGLALLAPGCLSQLKPAAPETPRYFRPEAPDPPTVGTSGVAAAGRTGETTLRLRRVRASGHLGERVAWRASDVEVGFYEMLRWTDPPAVLVEQALARELYERRGFRPWASGPAPTLAADILAFEEITAPAHEGRVELAVVLTAPDRGTLLHRVLAARRPVADRDAASLARAIGVALDDVVRQVAERVDEALRPPLASGPAGSGSPPSTTGRDAENAEGRR